MRLLAVGDLHGDTDILLRLLEQERPDGLLCVGDWGDAGEIDVANWARILDLAPVKTVFGNHDDLARLELLRNRDGSPVLLGQGEIIEDFCGVSLAGVSGIWAKSHREPHYVTDDDVALWAGKIAAGPAVDILLTHGCPVGVADRTPTGRPGGQRCFLDLLRIVRPHVYLCGHLHVAQHRILADPPCSVFNTGALPSGHYVEIRITDEGISAEFKRLALAKPPES